MIKNLLGQRFGRLTVIALEDNVKSGSARWRCRCDCGNEISVRSNNLTGCGVRSCGCLAKHNALKHGDSKTRLYNIWYGIIRRTEDSSRKEYKDYGGRGIKMCSEWRQSYEVFREWALANGYTDEHSIDRVENDGDYTPDNCRWAERIEQANNRTDTHYLTKDGITKPATVWAKELGVPYMRIKKRIRLGWPDERVLA